MANTDKNLYLKTHADINSYCFFSIIEQIEQSSCVEGQNWPDSHDLNTNGLLGFIFKIRKNYNNRRVVPNIFDHIAYLLRDYIFEDGGLCLLFASAAILDLWEILSKRTVNTY